MFIDEDYWYSLNVDELTDCIDISELFGFELDTSRPECAKILKSLHCDTPPFICV